MRARSRARCALGLLAAVGVEGLAGCADHLSLPTLAPTEQHATSMVLADQSAAAAWVSAYRRSHGLAAVAVDPALERVAQAQADAMASANVLSHTVAGALSRRLGRIAQERHAYIENLSAGYATMDSALHGWQRSPGHDANLLFAPMRRVGIAAATAPDTRYKTFWSLVMTD